MDNDKLDENGRFTPQEQARRASLVREMLARRNKRPAAADAGALQEFLDARERAREEIWGPRGDSA